jgi:hypothetical protein
MPQMVRTIVPMSSAVGETGVVEFAAMDDVQLGEYDVPAQVLAAAGVPLTELVGDQGAASVDTLMGPVPIDGWRVISGPFPPEPGASSVLAAPWQGPPWHPGSSNGWMQVRFTRTDGDWSACVTVDYRPVRPGRRHRRAGIRLQWHSTLITAPAGASPEVRLSLRNTASVPWQPDGIDHGFVRAWAVGTDGLPLARSRRSTFIAIPVEPLSELDPNSTLDLTATWDTEISALAPGDYVIEAELCDLQLRCAPGTLRLR